MDDDFDWGAWLDSQSGGPLPQGSYDIDDLLSGYFSDPSIAYASSSRGQDTLSAMGAADDTAPGMFDKTIGAVRGLFGDKGADLLKTYGPKLFDFATSKGGVAGIAALIGALQRQKESGGGTGMGMPAPRQYTRSVDPSGIVRYAAEGGLMHAYAQGGAVRPFPMQDGGFVMTGDAVKGAGGIEALKRVLPEARPITGPGTATSDSIPATIRGRNGVTPAKVSNGEAYVPPGRDTRGLYALMRQLERKA